MLCAILKRWWSSLFIDFRSSNAVLVPVAAFESRRYCVFWLTWERVGGFVSGHFHPHPCSHRGIRHFSRIVSNVIHRLRAAPLDAISMPRTVSSPGHGRYRYQRCLAQAQVAFSTTPHEPWYVVLCFRSSSVGYVLTDPLVSGPRAESSVAHGAAFE